MIVQVPARIQRVTCNAVKFLGGEEIARVIEVKLVITEPDLAEAMVDRPAGGDGVAYVMDKLTRLSRNKAHVSFATIQAELTDGFPPARPIDEVPGAQAPEAS